MNTSAATATIDARVIINRIGKQRLADALDVSVSSIGNAHADNLMPAKWFAVVSGLCREKRMRCPVTAFAFILREGEE